VEPMNAYRALGVLLVLLSPLIPAGAASAEHRPVSAMTLTLRTSDGETSRVRLKCDPAGGSHPNPLAACDEVESADGDFSRLPGTPEQLACTMEYRPVVASARGRWDGETVRWRQKYSNACTLHTATGAVFAF